MKHLIDFIIRKRVPILVLITVLTLLLGYVMTRVILNADFSTYLRQDDPVVQKFNMIGEEYGSKSIALVMIEAEDVFNRDTLNLIRDLTEAYEGLEGIAYVTSLTNVLDFKKTAWGLEVGKLIPRGNIPEGKEGLERLREYVLSKEMYVNDLVSKDGKSTVIALRLKHGVYEYDVTKEIKRITETIASDPGQISYGGMPFMMYNMTLLILQAVERLEPITIFLMLFILFLGFRKAGGVFVPFLVVVFSVIWTVGLMAIFNISLNMLTGVVPIILVAMGSADGIHVMRRYYEKRQTGIQPRDAVKETFSELGAPIIITTFTTMIGFSSLLISNFSAIQQFGLVTSLGVFLALVVTFLFIPILLSFSKPKILKQKNPVQSKKFLFMDHLAALVFNHKAVILLSAGLIVIVAALIIPRIKKDVDFSLCLRKGSKEHRAEMVLRRDYGGTVPVQALVKGRIKDPFTLKAMRYLERYLETVPSVSETQSMAALISEMNEVMNDRYVVPESGDGVANLWFLIEGEEIVEQLVKEDETEGLIQARLDTWDTGVLSKAVDEVNQFIEALPEKIVVVDLNKLSSDVREILFGIRSQRISDNLVREIVRKQLPLDREMVNTIVRTSLFRVALKEKDKRIVEQKMKNYLLSDEAEIATVSEESAARIARRIMAEIENNRDIGWKQVLTMTKSELESAEKEDLEELARSLEEVIKDALGDARVSGALEEIKEILPPDAHRNGDLFRNLKGAFWEMNESLMALGMDEYKTLPTIPEPSVIREVPVSFESTGLAAVLKRMEEELIPSQVLSLFLALALVAIAMGFIFRSLSLGVIGIIPISLTILVNFALLGWFNIGLDSFTSMVASVAIGLGIDTDVHFISSFKREFSRWGDELQALKKTLSTTGVAILINALAVGLGFGVLLFAGGQHMRRFGGLVSLTLIVSAIFTFTVLPAVIMIVKPKFLKGERKK